MIHLKAPKTASKGIIMGNVFLHKVLNPEPSDYKKSDNDLELAKYHTSTKNVLTSLEELARTNDIFLGHIEILNDLAFRESISSKILSTDLNIEQALFETTEEFATIFKSMDDEYMRERACDIYDVSTRLMLDLKGLKNNDLTNFSTPVILVASDLSPSQTATLDTNKILGFITEFGGITSHVSIMARSLGLPALVGVSEILSNTKSDDFIIFDAKNGDIFINPDDEIIAKYKILQQKFANDEIELKKLESLDAISIDKKIVKVFANVGNIVDIKNAISKNINGVGLFRTEFLYMESSDFPSEETQFKIYKEACILCSDEVVIRTLDIGGDKGLSYFDFPSEENPFLGFRALRICLNHPEIFKTQLRALLRASHFGNMKIMYPFVISVEEILKANDILLACKTELRAENIPFNENIKVGIMIETPSSVLLCEEFAKHVNFFSIGTNDLTQYLLAVDRGNKKISHLYNSFHPAILHAIKRVIDAGHSQNIEVGMCGEFASDEKACRLLFGMGLDEFSVSALEASNIKRIIRSSSFSDCQILAQKISNAYTIDDVLKILQ